MSTSRARISYVIGSLDLGGAEGQLVALARGLDSAAFEPSIWCLSHPGPLASEAHQAGIRVHDLHMDGLRLVRSPLETIRRLGEFVRGLQEERPHIIHGFLFHGYVVGAMAGKLARVPIVVSARRSLGNFKTGNRALLAIERVANSFTDLLIANSSAVRSDVLLQEGVRAEKVVVIRNGLDVSRYELMPKTSLMEDLRLAAKSPVVTVIANLIHYKGHRYLLEAWARVVEAVPRSVALLVGEGPQRAELESRARDLGIEASVRFLGRRTDVPEILAVTDILVHPSLEEGFCNAILEAMAAGKPVVATTVGGNPEAVVDGETGILVPPRDAESLAQAVLALMKEPEKARKMGLAGRARVEREFGLQTMVERYEQVYLDLLERKKVRLDPR